MPAPRLRISNASGAFIFPVDSAITPESVARSGRSGTVEFGRSVFSRLSRAGLRPSAGFALNPLVCAALVLALLNSGCATSKRRGKSSPPPPQTLVAPRHTEIGRVLSHDATEATVVIEFVPHVRPNPFLAGTRLLTRQVDTLEPTAELEAAPYQSGRMFGAYVRSGTPGVGDEVVIPPEAP